MELSLGILKAFLEVPGEKSPKSWVTSVVGQKRTLFLRLINIPNQSLEHHRF